MIKVIVWCGEIIIIGIGISNPVHQLQNISFLLLCIKLKDVFIFPIF
jgi:hypothetical protein